MGGNRGAKTFALGGIWTNEDTDRCPRKMQGKNIQRDGHRINRHTKSITKSFKIDE